MGNEDFECTRVIGKGSYGEVWLAKHKKDKKPYVLKKMNLGKASKKERKSAEQEAKLLSKLRHPNIVSYKDSFETDGFLYIAMQYCEGGDLYARLKEQKGALLEERQVVEWFVQIAMALQYMHERNILHRDLKTQNIFLTKSKIIKVGDLGIARMLDSASAMATTLIGTPYYMSPELFSNKPYNHKSDVWALGCCVYEMTTLKHAFNAKDMNSLVYKILKGKMPPMPCQYSSELLILMRSMLHQDPEKRPSVNRILRDPYIKKNIAVFLEDTKKNSAGQLPSKQITLSVSRPPSASTSRKDSSAASLEEADQATNISNSVLQKHKVPENVSVKPSNIRKPYVSLSDHGTVSEKSAEPNKSLSGKNTPETIVPQAVKEMHVHQEKNALHNHIIGSKMDYNEMEPPDTKWPGCKPNVEQSSSIQPNNSGQSVPEHENFVSSNRTGPGHNKAEVNSGIGQTIKNLKSGHLEGNESGVPDLQEMPLKTESKTRPLPVPRAMASAGEPRHREDRLVSNDFSRSSSVSSSTEERETPRSLPNLSARQRRRQQKSESTRSKENPTPTRIKLKRVVERTESDKTTKSEKSDVHPSRLRPTRQSSINDNTSSSDESQQISKKEGTKEKEVIRENKEINSFICLLDTTLQLNDLVESSGDDEELIPSKVESEALLLPTPPPQQLPTKDEHFHKSVSMPSVETLTDTSRLMHRIRMLHKDCIKGVGYKAVEEANAILNRIDEDEVEPKLINLLGKDKFDEYAGKIWQLKFCEESLYKAP